MKDSSANVDSLVECIISMSGSFKNMYILKILQDLFNLEFRELEIDRDRLGFLDDIFFKSDSSSKAKQTLK